VLAAAQAAFSKDGPGVALDEIARRAGVGAGTVHRHFATKQALIGAVVLDRLTALADVAEDLAHAEDPTTAFFGFLRRLVEEASNNQVLASALGTNLREEAAAAGATLRDRVGALLERAQQARALRRTDLTAADLHALIVGMIETERRLPAVRRGLSVDLFSDGLRKPAASHPWSPR
jgi:AcrR family transcriptional regulator